jgi:hypothetical protein
VTQRRVSNGSEKVAAAFHHVRRDHANRLMAIREVKCLMGNVLAYMIEVNNSQQMKSQYRNLPLSLVRAAVEWLWINGHLAIKRVSLGVVSFGHAHLDLSFAVNVSVSPHQLKFSMEKTSTNACSTTVPCTLPRTLN